MSFTPIFAFLQNLSAPELILILFVFVLLFGARKLPELSRAVGKSIGEFKRGRQELDEEIKTAEKAEQDEAKPSSGPPPVETK